VGIAQSLEEARRSTLQALSLDAWEEVTLGALKMLNDSLSAELFSAVDSETGYLRVARQYSISVLLFTCGSRCVCIPEVSSCCFDSSVIQATALAAEEAFAGRLDPVREGGRAKAAGAPLRLLLKASSEMSDALIALHCRLRSGEDDAVFVASRGVGLAEIVKLLAVRVGDPLADAFLQEVNDEGVRAQRSVLRESWSLPPTEMFVRQASALLIPDALRPWEASKGTLHITSASVVFVAKSGGGGPSLCWALNSLSGVESLQKRRHPNTSGGLRLARVVMAADEAGEVIYSEEQAFFSLPSDQEAVIEKLLMVSDGIEPCAAPWPEPRKAHELGIASDDDDEEEAAAQAQGIREQELAAEQELLPDDPTATMGSVVHSLSSAKADIEKLKQWLQEHPEPEPDVLVPFKEEGESTADDLLDEATTALKESGKVVAEASADAAKAVRLRTKTGLGALKAMANTARRGSAESIEYSGSDEDDT